MSCILLRWPRQTVGTALARAKAAAHDVRRGAPVAAVRFAKTHRWGDTMKFARQRAGRQDRQASRPVGVPGRERCHASTFRPISRDPGMGDSDAGGVGTLRQQVGIWSRSNAPPPANAAPPDSKVA